MATFKDSFDQLFNPLLQALHKLGGSGSVQEIENEVAKLLNLSIEKIYDPHKENKILFGYRLAQARDHLKSIKLIKKSSTGVWSLTAEGLKTSFVKREKGYRCCVCHRMSNDIITINSKGDVSKYMVCSECDQQFLSDLSESDKCQVIQQAFKLSIEHKLYLPYAINTIYRRYSVKEARHRTLLREREKSGKSVDIYSMAHRVKGNFRGKG